MSGFRMVLHVIVATILLILLSLLCDLHTFYAPTVILVVAIAVVVSIVAFVFYAALAILVCMICGYVYPGIVLITILGTMAGTVSLRVLSVAAPQLLTFPSLLSAVPYAVFNTLLIWGLGYVSGTFKSGTPSFGPVKKTKT